MNQGALGWPNQEPSARSFKVTGKPGATAAPPILAGGTTSGAPTTGRHVAREVVIDATGEGWYCTVGGTPGTWVTMKGAGGGGGDVATDAIWDAAGDTVYGTGANTAARLAAGAGLRLYRMNAAATAPEWVDPAAIIGPGTVLASTFYAPGSDGETYTTTSTTLVDVDATNLAVTFTVPPSGQVDVRLAATAREAGGNNVYWGLREGAGVVSGTEQNVAAGASMFRPYYVVRITGLTSGASKTYKFAFRCDAGTAAMWLGPTRGKASLQVFAA